MKTNKTKPFWIDEKTVTFDKLSDCEPESFAFIQVIELAPMLKMMEMMADTFDKFSKIRSLPLTDINDSDEEIANQYSSVIDGFIFRSKEIIESYKAFKRENGLE